MTDNKLLYVEPSPHVKHSDNSRTIMLDVIIAMIPAMLWGIYVFGLRALVMVAVSVASSVLFEYAYQRILKRPVTTRDLSAIVTGMLIGFNLPVTTPYWVPVAGSFFAIVIVKQLFGGIGKNVVNPALAARVFIFIAWPDLINTYVEPMSERFSLTFRTGDIVAGATPLGTMKTGGASGIPVLELFIGDMPGCIGEVSALLIIIGGIYLVARRVISLHIPLAFIGTVAVLTYLFPQTQSVQAFEFMAMQLFSGGLMLGAVFMATDYATSPVTSSGRIIYGIGCGAITVFIRFFGGYNEGVSFAILIMNLLVWYIDSFTRPKPFGYIKRKAEKGGAK